MLLDRALRLTFGTFSTLFLVVLIAVAPLQLAYAYAYRDVIAVADLHDEIEEFPAARQVRGVGPDHVEEARRAQLVLLGVELLLLAALVRAARRIVHVESSRDVPGALDAWLHVFRRRPASDGAGPVAGGRASGRERLFLVAGGILVSLAVGVLAHRIGLLLGDPVPDDLAWTARAAVEALARALGAPFVLVCAALARHRAKEVDA